MNERMYGIVFYCTAHTKEYGDRMQCSVCRLYPDSDDVPPIYEQIQIVHEASNTVTSVYH
jgi:hypothetical protein